MPKKLFCLAVSCIYFGFSWIRRQFLRLNGRSVPPSCVILLYHSVADAEQMQFGHQLDILMRYATPIRADFVASLPGGRRFVCVTFDDGMVSFAKTALPELEKRRIPSAVFVVTAKLGQSPDWANFSDEPLTTELTMTAEQLRQISDRVLIGSHTATHPMMTCISEEQARCELAESREALERLLNEKVTQFSFPYGDFNDVLIEWCHDCGYKRVFTTLPLSFQSGWNGKVVGRVLVDPKDWALEYKLKILGAYQWLPVAYTIKRNIRRLLRKKTCQVAYDIRREHGH